MQISTFIYTEIVVYIYTVYTYIYIMYSYVVVEAQKFVGADKFSCRFIN